MGAAAAFALIAVVIAGAAVWTLKPAAPAGTSPVARVAIALPPRDQIGGLRPSPCRPTAPPSRSSLPDCLSYFAAASFSTSIFAAKSWSAFVSARPLPSIDTMKRLATRILSSPRLLSFFHVSKAGLPPTVVAFS